jgi:hypothetical protein
LILVKAFVPRVRGGIPALPGGYVVIRNPAELPKRLPVPYAQLTA